MIDNSNAETILIVDDLPENIRIVGGILSKYRRLIARNGEEAIQRATSKRPDLILLDIMMPGMDGYEVCRQLKSMRSTREIPIIFVTAKIQINDEVKGFEAGAADYITKPINPAILKARVKTQLALKHQNEILRENIKLREDVERIFQHDLKSPLCSIINYPKLIIKRGGLSEQQVDLLKKIEKAGFNMLNMIDHSFDLYKMEQGIYQHSSVPVDILSILKNIIHEKWGQMSSMDQSVIIKYNGRSLLDDDKFIVLGEPHLFYSMFSNLIKNALEASPREGVVCIELSEEETMNIFIQNEGAIPEDIRSSFFEKYATYGKNGGVGLGTYSAKLIAETLGGSISFLSSNEEGTTIRVQLPKENSDDL